MLLITQGKTNWKYILIVMILALIVGGGIFGYLKYFEREIFFLTKPPEIKKPEKVVEELCFKGKLEGKIIKEITDDSLLKSIIRVLIEEAENYGFSREEICESQLYNLDGEKIDLNGDGIPEYIILPEYFYTKEGQQTIIRGVTGNGPIYVFGFLQREWKLIGNFFGNWVKPKKDNLTKGYMDLIVHESLSAYSGYYHEYVWTGGKYELEKTTYEGPEVKETPEISPKSKPKIEEDVGKWKNYTNEKWGFEFKYPPVPAETKCEQACKLIESENEIKIGLLISLEILDSRNLDLLDFIKKEAEDMKIKESMVCITEPQKGGIIGGEQTFKIGCMDIDWIYLKHNERVYKFTVASGDTCCPELLNPRYESKVWEGIVSTFRFLK